MQYLRYERAQLRGSGGLGLLCQKLLILPHPILIGNSQCALSTLSTFGDKDLDPDNVVDRRLDIWHRLLFGALDAINLIGQSMTGSWCSNVALWLHVELVVVLLDLQYIKGTLLPYHSRKIITSYRLLAFACGREMRKLLNTL